MYTFYNIYDRYKNYFIKKNGTLKFQKIEEKIHTSKSIAQLHGLTIQKKIVPTQADFGATINQMTYFIFAGGETIAMAQLIAIKYWNEEINTVYGLCAESMLAHKAEAALNYWKISLSSL